ncbi:hypothetical protein ACFZDK_35275 [Streptomyces sp. NPDC007901]|uniref:hypothetical protein n=1 Tax=Streptomyces sp. NPDC007901 TaxID=3364785 RepID=UPI0036E5CB2C
MLDTAPDVTASHPGQTIIGDWNYYGREFEHDLTGRDLKLLRPARKGEPERAGAHLFKPPGQVIESINQTLHGTNPRLMTAGAAPWRATRDGLSSRVGGVGGVTQAGGDQTDGLVDITAEDRRGEGTMLEGVLHVDGRGGESLRLVLQDAAYPQHPGCALPNPG